MRTRLLPAIAFCFLVAAVTLPLWGQRGRMGGGMGMGARFGPARSVAGPMRAASVRVPARTNGMAWFQRPFFGFNGFNGFGFNPFFPVVPGFRHHHHPFGFNGFCGFGGFGCGAFLGSSWGWGWPGGGFWPSYDYGGFGGTYDTSNLANMQAQIADQQQMTAQLQQEIQQDRLRRAEQSAATPAPSKPQAAQPAQETTITPTVLVFRDGKQAVVQNYAIINDTLYAFISHATKKISLSDLNLPATVAANEDRGVEFVVPQRRSATP